MKVFQVVCCTSLLAACSGPAPSFGPADHFIVDTTIVDVVDGSLEPDMTVVIRDRSILQVTASAELATPDESQVLSTGGYLIPGLWDMHVHSLGDADDAISRTLPLYLANGVTGIRDMGSTVGGLQETRRRLNENEQKMAPAIVAAGPLLDGVRLPWYGDLPLVIEAPADVEAALTKLLGQGVDFFKVYDQLSPDVYDAIAAFAAANEIFFAGHPPRAVGISRAAAAGQHTIEHMSLFTFGDCVPDGDAWFKRALAAKFGDGGYPAYYEVVLEFFASIDDARCDAAIESMAEHGTYFTPTLGMELNDRDRVEESAFAFMSPGAREWCDATLAGIDAADESVREAAYAAFTSFTKKLENRGVTLLAGSDNPNYCLVPGFSLHWELERLVEAGLSPLEAMRSATIHAAAALGREDTEGRIAAGYRANLVLLEANPLENIRHTQRIAGVVSDGRWLDSKAIQAMLAAAREAAETIE